jgi:hypothetical protein
MVDITVVVVCRDNGAFWNDGEPPGCTDPDHDHRRVEVHRHRTEVALPGGVRVTAVSYDGADPYTRDAAPDFGLYLDDRWAPPWPHEQVSWPDFGVPNDPAPVLAALRGLLARAEAGESVELGCLGAHGRTGTALACLAVLRGVKPGDAVPWVRAHYCARAVETPDQERFVADLAS